MFLKAWKLENLKTLKTLKMILGTCWTTFVFMCKLKSDCLSCCHMWHWHWHADQLLFSCLCSKVTDYKWNWQCVFFDSSSIITLTYEFRGHRAGSQQKMSECQTKAENQECFEKLVNLKTLKTLKWSLGHAEQLLFHVWFPAYKRWGGQGEL